MNDTKKSEISEYDKKRCELAETFLNPGKKFKDPMMVKPKMDYRGRKQSEIPINPLLKGK